MLINIFYLHFKHVEFSYLLIGSVWQFKVELPKYYMVKVTL